MCLSGEDQVDDDDQDVGDDDEYTRNISISFYAIDLDTATQTHSRIISFIPLLNFLFQ